MSPKPLSGKEGTDLCARDVRALTEVMSTLDDTPTVRGADGLYEVVSQSGNTYTVDLWGPSCTCPDAEKRDVTCKHARRVMYAVGARPIPGWVQRGALDDQLGEHVDATPQVGRAATDGGVHVSAAQAADAPDQDERPAGCECDAIAIDDGDALPCWPCFRDGFDTPNPDAIGDA